MLIRKSDTVSQDDIQYTIPLNYQIDLLYKKSNACL